MIEVGQCLWYVPQRGYSKAAPGYEVFVSKVARKWIYINNGDRYWPELRIEREQPNASIMGYHVRDCRGDVVGHLYMSPSHERNLKLREEAWEKVTRFLRSGWIPPHVTLNGIEIIAKVLGVDLNEPASN